MSVTVTRWRRMQMSNPFNGHEAGFRGMTDGLATIGIDTLGRVEGSCPFGEVGQLASGVSEVLDVPVERSQVTIQEADHMMAGSLTLAAEIEDRGDFRERKAGGLCVAYEVEPVDRILGVFPIPIGGTVGFRKKADGFVVANGLGGRARSSSQFPDSHVYQYKPLDIPVDWRL